MEIINKSMLPWTDEHDSYLQVLITLHGTNNWDSVASGLRAVFPSSSKTPQECRERWQFNTQYTDSKASWTEHEELQMLIAHKRHQNKWSNMAQDLNGRNNNSIKNRFYSIFRKVKNKILKQDLNHESKFELLETLYVISLMERYFEYPLPTQRQINKRGKDFIYSLLKGLQLEIVTKYKDNLQKSKGKDMTLDKLWLELTGDNHAIKPETPIIPTSNNDPIDTELFAYINGLPPNNSLCYTLPRPHFSGDSDVLTTEEKTFIQVQVFGNKDTNSIKPFPPVYPPLPSALSYCSPATLSAGFAPTAAFFEGFSDFTEKNCCATKGYGQILDGKEFVKPEQQMMKGSYV